MLLILCTACPRYYVFYMRLMWLRRMLVKGSHGGVDLVAGLLGIYAARRLPGTYFQEEGFFAPLTRGPL